MTETQEPIADIGSAFADLDPSTERYAKRFSGVAGTWLLQRQTHALRHVLAGVPPGTVLDVGGGHGQVARPLLADGHTVTVHASCAEAHGQAALLSDDHLTFSTGSLDRLPFEDASFDVVASFRIVAHIGDWQAYLSELMRVARKTVVFDFPVAGGVNALQPLLFGLKKRLEGDTRRFATMTRKEVALQVQKASFAEVARFEQFVLPMVIHRKLARPGISERCEGAARALGLHRAFGTPVVLRADRVTK